MKNRNILIVGEPGAGKSTLAGHLIRLAPRVLVLDPVEDYGPAVDPMLELVDADPRAAVRYLVERWDEDFRLVYRPGLDPVREVDILGRLVERIQQEPEAPPLAVFLEEASVISETHQAPDSILRLYRMGRRWRVNLVAIIQVDTDIHRVFRHASHLVVTLRQRKLSTDSANWFRLDETAALETLTPGLAPVQGRHFLTSPDVPLFATWRDAVYWSGGTA